MPNSKPPSPRTPAAAARPQSGSPAEERAKAERLAAALRSNLTRRKAQQRSRRNPDDGADGAGG